MTHPCSAHSRAARRRLSLTLRCRLFVCRTWLACTISPRAPLFSLQSGALGYPRRDEERGHATRPLFPEYAPGCERVRTLHFRKAGMILCRSVNNVSVFPIATKGDITQFGTHWLGEKKKKTTTQQQTSLKVCRLLRISTPKTKDTSPQGSRSLIRGAPENWQPRTTVTFTTVRR